METKSFSVDIQNPFFITFKNVGKSERLTFLSRAFQSRNVNQISVLGYQSKAHEEPNFVNFHNSLDILQRLRVCVHFIWARIQYVNKEDRRSTPNLYSL